MYNYPKVTNTDKISTLFKALNRDNPPDKFTYRYLASLGFKSSQDRDLLDLLKFLDVVDNSGYPTHYYDSLDNLEKLNILVTSKYKSLLNSLESLNLKEIEGYLVTTLNYEKKDATKAAHTFLEMCSLAQIDKTDVNVPEDVPDNSSININTSGNVSPNLNININLPANADKDYIKTIFENLQRLLRK